MSQQYRLGSGYAMVHPKRALSLSAKQHKHLLYNGETSPTTHNHTNRSSDQITKVIWEEGRVAALSHTYAVKSPLVTMARPKFAPKVPFSWTDRQTPLPASSVDSSDLWCQTASRSDPPFFHNALDRPTHPQTDRSSTGKFDRY